MLYRQRDRHNSNICISVRAPGTWAALMTIGVIKRHESNYNTEAIRLVSTSAGNVKTSKQKSKFRIKINLVLVLLKRRYFLPNPKHC